MFSCGEKKDPNRIDYKYYESGSLECRKLIEAKESLIQIMQSLEYLNDANEIISEIFQGARNG